VPSQAEIQCECAFTYMNAVFRKNLTEALAVGANGVDDTSDTAGALNDDTDRARSCRTTGTCFWGVSDPENWARDRVRGVEEGVAHAPDNSSTAADRRAHGDTGGTKRRPLHRSEIAHSQGHRPIELAANHVRATSRLDDELRDERGNTAPASVFSLICINRSPNSSQPGRWDEGCGGEWDCGYDGFRASLRGSIRTRVPPSSIDRSAPRLMSSRCTSSALATMLTASSESRS